jgi:aarF domain-containing kinase
MGCVDFCLGSKHVWRHQHAHASRPTSHLALISSPQTTSVRQMSQQMKDVRSQMEEDENLKVLMSSLRGQNLSDADFAAEGVEMRLVMMDSDEGEGLPLEYDPVIIGDYWGRRPVAVFSRIVQLLSIAGGFLGGVGMDLLTGKSKENEVRRAIQLRNIMTSLGPAYIKLGQALSIRPDLLSPAAMNELQQLCDKVPSYDSRVAMGLLEQELGRPWQEIYSELTPEPIAAASLGQVYRGKLMTGEEVAVKVQRPGVLETVTVDLHIIRTLGLFMRRFPEITARADVVALLDEWAARFFEELDYVREGNNATRFANLIREDLPQVVVPKTYEEFTSRRVLTTQWLDGEKLSQSQADDVGRLVNVGVICYLKQLLDTGFFHADPHPGNMIRTPDGRLAILDFGLMTEIDDNIKYGMIEAISHLVHRDYESIVADFVTLDFIPPDTDLSPILPVLAKVFDQALEGGGAKNINFQDLAADLAQITFDYPFRIPPYFALIIRAIGVLEGIALVGDPDFAIVDEAFPYISKRLMTDDSPRLREALRYMVYGKSSTFDADRLIDLLDAFETFSDNSKSARGSLDLNIDVDGIATVPSTSRSTNTRNVGFPFPFPPGFPLPTGNGGDLITAGAGLLTAPLVAMNSFTFGGVDSTNEDARTREALKFILAPEGSFFREFLMEEAVKSVDALSRNQVRELVVLLGLEDVLIPIIVPGASRRLMPLAPSLEDDDEQVVQNLAKVVNFLSGGNAIYAFSGFINPAARDLLPFVPGLASEVLPEFSRRLFSRISARILRDVFVE